MLAVPAGSNETKVIEERMRRDVTYLASAECEGRGPGTKGINRAADYIANEFKKIGLKPAAADGTYFQPFKIRGISTVGEPNRLVIKGPEGKQIMLKLDEDFRPLGMSGTGKVSGPLVFAGYGVTAEGVEYDDYQALDVENKIVVVLRKTPRPDNTKEPFDGARANTHGALNTKVQKASNKKAAAVLFVNDYETLKNGDELLHFDYSGWGNSKVPTVHVRRAVAEEIVRSALNSTLADIEKEIDLNLKPQSAILDGWTAELEVTIDRSAVDAKNVVGVLEGEGPKANETVVVGAHYDHLGYGSFGSLARNLRAPVIHHGADDNASGTTALIELARRFAQMPKRDRRMVFMAFSGEERGLLGSHHYCQNPIFPLEDTVAMVNLDMVGRLIPDKETKKDRLIVYGTGTAKDFDALLEELNKKYDFKLQKVATGTGPSDHASFYAKNIPVFFFFTDVHEDYHRPSDTADKINVSGMRKVTDLTEEVTLSLVTRPERPEFVKVGGAARDRPRVTIPRLGVRPAYGDDKEGVLLEEVNQGGIADKAGIKAGDRIMEIGGKEVQNLEGYMAILAGRKKGDSFDIGLIRDGKKVTVKVTLE
jgi:hypothetical protein